MTGGNQSWVVRALLSDLYGTEAACPMGSKTWVIAEGGDGAETDLSSSELQNGFTQSKPMGSSIEFNR
tara:strand:- start:1618 stop:1821 length:204 start_codon:yes stop_codon:yes gene_type:complete